MRRTRLLDLVLILIVFLVALGPRLAIAQDYSEEPQSEEELYNRYAVAWASHEGAQPREKFLPWHPLGSFTHRPPAYVLFIGAIYRLAGMENYAAVRMVQAWLDAGSMVLLYLLGVLVFGGLVGRAVGLTAAIATARYDFLMLFVGRILSESLYLWLTLVFLVLAIVALRRGWPLLTLVAAFVLGWANLTRPFLIFVLPGYLLWLAIAPRLKRRWRHVALAIIGMVLAIGPVTLRNWQFHHQFILISTNSGPTLYNSLTDVEGLSAPEELGTREEVKDLELPEIEESAEFQRRALNYMRRHPGDLPAIFGRKVRILLAAKGGHTISHVLMVTPDDEWFYPLVLVGAALAFVVRPRRHWHTRLLIYGVIVSQLLVSLLANAEVRYRVPVVPLLALLSAWLVWGLIAPLPEAWERLLSARSGSYQRIRGVD
jgi:4-amino-4-deoxy-L-arabinose transferase-like glycosyltransferase